MARARNLKPGFFKNEVLATLNPYARLLYASLWCQADREGRLEDRPARIRIEAFPYEILDIEPWLVDLDRTGFIRRYAANDGNYIQVLTFKRHQNPHFKEQPSGIPEPTTEELRQAQTFPGHASGLPQSCPADSLFSDSPLSESPISDSARLGRAMAQAVERDWKEIRESYPKRDGGMRWGDAERFYRARLREGHTHVEILDGVKRYAAHCLHKQIARTDKVQQAATFLGSNKGFLEPWTVQSGGGAIRDPNHAAKMKLEQDLIAARANTRKFNLKQQMKGEPDDTFIARVERDVTDALMLMQAGSLSYQEIVPMSRAKLITGVEHGTDTGTAAATEGRRNSQIQLRHHPERIGAALQRALGQTDGAPGATRAPPVPVQDAGYALP